MSFTRDKILHRSNSSIRDQTNSPVSDHINPRMHSSQTTFNRNKNQYAGHRHNVMLNNAKESKTRSSLNNMSQKNINIETSQTKTNVSQQSSSNKFTEKNNQHEQSLLFSNEYLSNNIELTSTKINNNISGRSNNFI